MASITTTPAIEAVDLVKSYPSARRGERLRALDGLSFAAAPGTIFGLLGPNGAGKSTTVKILATLTRADAGSARIAGIDVDRHPDRVRRAIGFVAQRAVADPGATGLENLVLAGRMQGLTASDARARAAQLLERFSLAPAARRIVRTYSGGMARKLDVAIGLMHRPQVVFLDEPTTGLDPEARADLWAELEAMTRHEHMTVLLTTHYLEEADRLAAQVAIVDHGRIVATGTPDELKSALHGDALTVELDLATTTPTDLAARALRAASLLPALSEVTLDGSTLRARADHGAVALPHVLTALDGAGIAVAAATVARPSLDDVYLSHTGRSLSTREVAA